MPDSISLQTRVSQVLNGGDQAAQLQLRDSILADGVTGPEFTEVGNLLRHARADVSRVIGQTSADLSRVDTLIASGNIDAAERLLADVKGREDDALAMRDFSQWLFNEVEPERFSTLMRETSLTADDFNWLDVDWKGLWASTVKALKTIPPAARSAGDA